MFEIINLKIMNIWKNRISAWSSLNSSLNSQALYSIYQLLWHQRLCPHALKTTCLYVGPGCSLKLALALLWLTVVSSPVIFPSQTGDTWNTYFIRNRRYWRFDESRSQVDLGYPKNFVVDWMDCKEDDAETANDMPKVDQLRATNRAPTASLSTSDSGSAPIARASTICVFVLSWLSLRLIHRWQ